MTHLRLMANILRKTVAEFLKDNCSQLAAALAFYTALSIAPLLLVVIAIAGAVYGRDAARGEVVAELELLLGADGARTVEGLLACSRPEAGGLVAGVVGMATLLVGAVGVFTQLQDALNTIWSIAGKRPRVGFRQVIKDRLLAFAMVCGMALLLLASMLLGALLDGVGGTLREWWPGSAGWLGTGNVALSLVVTLAMFAMIFQVLPYVRLALSDVWLGAALTTGLFTAGKFLIGLYLGTVAPGSAFGAAGSFVALLLWLYYSSAILLFGAEFTQVYATACGTAVGGAQVEGAPEGVRTDPSFEPRATPAQSSVGNPLTGSAGGPG